MPKFRKKPVEIDAWRFRLGDLAPAWMGDAMSGGKVWFQGGDAPYLTIKTLLGEMRANPGDWVVRGVAGELYPVHPDIFEKTYEPA